MIRIITIYGLIAGIITIVGMIGSITVGGGHGSVWLGYLILLLGLSAVFVGVKQYRDQARGGVIRFLPALGLGLAITLLASVAYVAIWEAYSAFTHYAYMEQYAAASLAEEQARGLAGAALAQKQAELAAMVAQYRGQPLYRFGVTFVEIFPVGLLVSLVSAALLRNPRFLPAKTRA